MAKNKNSVASVTIQQFGKALAGNIIADVPTMVKSHPGIGKTTGCQWVYSKMVDRFPGGFHCLSTTDYTSLDIGGLWSVDQGRTVRNPVGFIPLDQPVFILIDEFGDCPAHEQSGWYRLANNHVLGDRKLCKGSYVAIATNRSQDNAAANEVSSAMVGRCSVLNLRADWQSTVDYANEQKWFPSIIGFLRAFGEDAIDNGFNPDSEFCGSTPRDFEHLNRMETAKVISSKDADLAMAQIVSKLDYDIGSRYFAFRSIKLPSVQNVFDNPKTAEIPDEIQTQCAFAAALVGATKPENYSAFVEYALRCDRVLGYSLCWDLAKQQPTFQKSPQFTIVATTFMELVS